MSVVLFLSGSTLGDALGAIGRSMRETFEDLGHEFVEVSFANDDGLQNLNRVIVDRPIEFVLSFAAMGADLSAKNSDGKEMNLWGALGVPFVSLFGDSPAYFFDRHVMPGPGFASIYAYPEHYRLRKALPLCEGLIGINPPRLIDPTPKSGIDFRKKETGRLLFLKNGNNPSQLVASWRDALPSGIFLMLTDLAGDLAGNLHTDQGCNIDAVVCAYFLDKGLDVEGLTKLRLFFIAQLDDYLRRLKSTFIAETLIDFPVEVHGEYWDHIDFSGKRAKRFPGNDYTDSKYLIRDSLGIIDMSPNTSEAPHDRPQRAYGLQTLCLTNEQEFFRLHFEQHHAFTFRFEMESIQARIADVLAHPKRYVELGFEVADTFRKKFDPDHFGRMILETAACVRLAIQPVPHSNIQPYFIWPTKVS